MLTGDRICLRAPEDGDWFVLHQLRNDVVTQVALMSTPRANSMERVRHWVSQVSADAGSLFYVIAGLDDGDPVRRGAVGYIQLVNMNPLHGHGELGICLSEGSRSRGYAADAIETLLRHAVQVFSLRKVTLRVRRDNIKAIALYHRTRFREVGVLQAHHYHDGSYHDVVIMERLLR